MDSALYEQISADPNIDYLRPHLAIARRLQKPLVIEEFGYPRDGFAFTPGSATAARDGYYRYVFSLVSSEPVVSGCNFWAWGGTARPKHEQWQVGDPYTGDPAQEQQGLNSVFSCDTTTLQILPR